MELNMKFFVILTLLTIQAAALPITTKSQFVEKGFNDKECGGENSYHMRRMQGLKKMLNAARKPISEIQMITAIEGHASLCNQSALWKVKLPVFQRGKSLEESAIRLKEYSSILTAYRDNALETFELSNSDSNVPKVQMYHRALWKKMEIDNLKARINVKEVIVYLNTTFENFINNCGAKVSEEQIEKATSGYVKDIKQAFKRQQNKCKSMENHKVPILRRQAEDLQLIWDNLTAEVQNRINNEP